LEAENSPRFIAAGDLDGDGDIDIAVPNRNSHSISVFANLGSGAFKEQVSYDAGRGPINLVAADFDGDRLLDLAAAAEEDLRLFRNQGGGAFQPLDPIVTGLKLHYGLLSADLNGDGLPELIAGSPASHRLAILNSRGDGSFAAPWLVALSPAPELFSDWLSAADLDGDGDADLIAGIQPPGDAGILFNQLISGPLPGTPKVCESLFRRGDANDDAGVDVSDAIVTLEFLFLGRGVISCEDAADSNGDGDVDITDGIYTLTYKFLGGQPPPPPSPETCGHDPSDGDPLTCSASTACR
jgi:hypothetical protein